MNGLLEGLSRGPLGLLAPIHSGLVAARDAIYSIPAVDEWRMGVGQRVDQLLTNPAEFYKSALMDAVPTPAQMGRTFADPSNASQADKDAMLGFGLLGLTAYHGSPHKFDKFDVSKVGTGEGAQVFGHGLYFAENPSVARGYREGLSGKYSVEGMPAIPRNASGHAAMDFKSDLEQLMGVSSVRPQSDMIPFLRKRLEDRVQYWKQQSQTGGSATDDMNALVSWYEGHLKPRVSELGPQTVKPGGALYKVDIPDEAVAKMLDWDKPIGAEIKQRVIAALPEHKRDLSGAVTGADRTARYVSLARGERDITGAELYGLLERDLGSVRASEFLRGVGFPGIKYLDQYSRKAGKGTSNFVVFDDALPKIIGRE